MATSTLTGKMTAFDTASLLAKTQIKNLGMAAQAAAVALNSMASTSGVSTFFSSSLSTSMLDSIMPSSIGSFDASNILPKYVGAHASGGSVLAGSTYLVGERGPELFAPRTAGTIIPNNRLGQSGGGGNANVTIVQNIQANRETETKTSGQGAQPWSEMAKSIEGIVRQTIQKEQRLGNSLNPVFGRASGGL
jgi:phage-related minor tail protein